MTSLMTRLGTVVMKRCLVPVLDQGPKASPDKELFLKTEVEFGNDAGLLGIFAVAQMLSNRFLETQALRLRDEIALQLFGIDLA